MKALDDVSLLDILPGGLEVKDEARAIDPQLRTINTDAPLIYTRIDALSSGILDHIAAQYDVTVWRDDWLDNVKRSVLKTAIADKSRKGTVASVKNAVSSLGPAVSIKEWWQYGGEPHTFKIFVAQSEIEGHVAADVQTDILAAVDDAKPARSLYDFIIEQPLDGVLNMCGIVRAATYARVTSTGRTQADGETGIGVAALARAVRSATDYHGEGRDIDVLTTGGLHD